jgi:deoxyribonuclease-4
MGSTFEEIAGMLDAAEGHSRIGVCLDTCHLLASGYDLCSKDGYEATFTKFQQVVGFDRLKLFHLNDSKKPCQSRVDRHEHIGKGCLGLEPFRRLVNDPRFSDLPMIIETEKTERTVRRKALVEIDPLDEANLRTLRSLVNSQ